MAGSPPFSAGCFPCWVQSAAGPPPSVFEPAEQGQRCAPGFHLSGGTRDWSADADEHRSIANLRFYDARISFYPGRPTVQMNYITVKDDWFDSVEGQMYFELL